MHTKYGTEALADEKTTINSWNVFCKDASMKCCVFNIERAAKYHNRCCVQCQSSPNEPSAKNENYHQGFRPFPLLRIKNRTEYAPGNTEKAFIVRFYISRTQVA